MMLARGLWSSLRQIGRSGLVGRQSFVHDASEGCRNDGDDEVVRNALLDELRAVGFSTVHGKQLLDKHPRLVTESTLGRLQNSYLELRRFMPKASALAVVQKTPLVALRDAEDLERINDYVTETMGIPNAEMTRSKIFDHTLDHIKSRHLFVYRAGLYELPDREGQTKDIQNPSLRKIVDTSDSHFVQMCELTLEEYRAFKNILYLESEALDLENDEYADEEFTHSEEGEQLASKNSYHSRNTRTKRRYKRGKK